MSDSRQRIIEVLKRRGEASVTELSLAVGLTPVTIRHHLDALLEEGVVSEPAPRRKPGPGRPEMVYALTGLAESLTPRNYGELCACLLDALSDVALDSDRLLAMAGEGLPNLSPRPQRSGVGSALGFLETRGYFPSVEHSDAGPAILLANCPYLEVARSHPQVCQFDIALLTRLVGAPVSVETSIALDDSFCRLRLPSGAVV